MTELPVNLYIDPQILDVGDNCVIDMSTHTVLTGTRTYTIEFIDEWGAGIPPRGWQVVDYDISGDNITFTNISPYYGSNRIKITTSNGVDEDEYSWVSVIVRRPLPDDRLTPGLRALYTNWIDELATRQIRKGTFRGYLTESPLATVDYDNPAVTTYGYANAYGGEYYFTELCMREKRYWEIKAWLIWISEAMRTNYPNQKWLMESFYPTGLVDKDNEQLHSMTLQAQIFCWYVMESGDYDFLDEYWPDMKLMIDYATIDKSDDSDRQWVSYLPPGTQNYGPFYLMNSKEVEYLAYLFNKIVLEFMSHAFEYLPRAIRIAGIRGQTTLADTLTLRYKQLSYGVNKYFSHNFNSDTTKNIYPTVLEGYITSQENLFGTILYDYNGAPFIKEWFWSVGAIYWNEWPDLDKRRFYRTFKLINEYQFTWIGKIDDWGHNFILPTGWITAQGDGQPQPGPGRMLAHLIKYTHYINDTNYRDNLLNFIEYYTQDPFYGGLLGEHYRYLLGEYPYYTNSGNYGYAVNPDSDTDGSITQSSSQFSSTHYYNHHWMGDIGNGMNTGAIATALQTVMFMDEGSDLLFDLENWSPTFYNTLDLDDWVPTFTVGSPSLSPSISPSLSPSFSPSLSPSLSPSFSPSLSPSNSPSVSPSTSISPSKSPSISPSVSPSDSPSFNTHSLDLERGSSQYATITDGAQTGLDITGDITIEGWIKLESLPSSYPGTFIIAGKLGADGNLSYWGYIDDTNKLILRWTSTGNFANISSLRSDGPFFTVSDVGQWVHFALIADVSGPTGVIYKNGSPVSSSMESTGSTAIYNGTADFRVGASGTPGDYFDGLIDELRIWNDIRTAQEISDEMYNVLVGNESNLVAYYKFDNNYQDSTSNNNDLTASGSPVFSTDIPFPPSPSASPSLSPSASPSLSPSASPSLSPSVSPSLSPSISISPSVSPSTSPSISPSSSPLNWTLKDKSYSIWILKNKT